MMLRINIIDEGGADTGKRFDTGQTDSSSSLLSPVFSATFFSLFISLSNISLLSPPLMKKVLFYQEPPTILIYGTECK